MVVSAFVKGWIGSISFSAVGGGVLGETLPVPDDAQEYDVTSGSTTDCILHHAIPFLDYFWPQLFMVTNIHSKCPSYIFVD